jgi:hypothetical protein
VREEQHKQGEKEIEKKKNRQANWTPQGAKGTRGRMRARTQKGHALSDLSSVSPPFMRGPPPGRQGEATTPFLSADKRVFLDFVDTLTGAPPREPCL